MKLRIMQVVVTTGAISRAKLQSNHHHQQTNIHLLQARCPSCCPTNSVRALSIFQLTDIYLTKYLTCISITQYYTVHIGRTAGDKTGWIRYVSLTCLFRVRRHVGDMSIGVNRLTEQAAGNRMPLFWILLEPTINQQPAFYRLDALPVTQPTVSQHRRTKYRIPRTC